jgi:GMP synthase-like glutamine amidotransferase
MNIGVVNMTGNKNGIKYIIEALSNLEYTPNIYDYTTEEEIFNIINTSNINNWIFSGSPHMVIDTNVPIVPLEIFNLSDKKFMLICYSMESVLYQLGFPVKKRFENKKEKFILTIDMKKVNDINKTNIFTGLSNKLIMRRNHHYYIPSNIIDNNMKLVSSYRKESMMIFYRNSILVQFHPERTPDGYKIIKNWIIN